MFNGIMDFPKTSKAKVVVGLDFGTTFSGFAYALTSKPDEVYNFYDWPDLGAAGGGHYCKTQTSLLYETGNGPKSFLLQDWGYSALVKYTRGMKSKWLEKINHGEDVLCIGNQLSPAPVKSRPTTQFLTLFKLHLVGGEGGKTLAAELPQGLTIRRVVSDYLREMSQFIMTILRRKLGSHISMEDVQWCLTVPATWDDGPKQEMKCCASMAGMVKGPECPLGYKDSASPHPVMIVIEPEAASLYCQRKLQFPLKNGDKFLIVDIGGGTVDLALHEKINDLKVREVSPSCSGLFGGSFVDKAFFDFLSRKISCFQEFARTHTDSVIKLKGWWETIKFQFDGNMHVPYDLELPARLAQAWEEDSCQHTRGKSPRSRLLPLRFVSFATRGSEKPIAKRHSKNPFSNLRASYNAIELSLDDMLSLFDPVVNGILMLIKSKLVEGLNLEAMMIVGGFSSSPYLAKRIREEFSTRVRTILVPDDPGRAIFCGAVFHGIYGPGVLLSRIAKKTYGIKTTRPSCKTDPPESLHRRSNGELYCYLFCVYTKKNDEIPLDHSVSNTHRRLPGSSMSMIDSTRTTIRLLSTSDSNPKYECDPGVTVEGKFIVPHPSEKELGEPARFLISIYFGRTSIEVEVKGLNFGNGEEFKMPPVRLEESFE